MRLRDIKISKQLNIGLGIMTLLMAVLAIVSMVKTESLWQKAKVMYDHPFVVKEAIKDANIGVMNIRIVLEGLMYENTGDKIQEARAAIDTYEADIFRQYEILHNSYLGPRSDIENVYNSTVQWKVSRDETIRLVQEGKLQQAVAMVMSSGTNTIKETQISDNLNTISVFASDKANELFTDAQNERNRSVAQMMIIVAMVLLASITISLVLRRGIMTPLYIIGEATEKFRQGKLDTRSSYVSGNEFGTLSNLFNIMTQSVQNDIELKDKASSMSAKMFLHDDLHLFCKDVLKTILVNTDSQIGAIYFLSKDKKLYEPLESIGLSYENIKSFSADAKEGELGLTLATRKIQHIKNIPQDAYIPFSAVSGNFAIKDIITIPLLKAREVVAIISIASIKEYSEFTINLIKGVNNELTARVNSLLVSQQIVEFSNRLQNTNIELQQQSKELEMQSDELKEQNIELEIQKNQLDEASKLKSSFLSNMSHELRTPLNSVIALASVLNRRLSGVIPDEEYSYLDVIERNGRNLLGLVNDILDLAKIEAGKDDVECRDLNIYLTINEIVEMIEPQVKNKGISLNNEMAKDLPFIFSDEKKCRHILQNVIANAVKFTDDGEVSIFSEIKGENIHITIKDTGIGIEKHQMEFIFDEFRQADESLSRRNGGTGLGLNIAKKYARMLGGKIEVESQIGVGSVFTVILPLTTDRSNVEEIDNSYKFTQMSKNTIRMNSAKFQNKKILLVDDSEPAIVQTTDILVEQGYQVFVARNGMEALYQMDKIKPDGMILDLMMPVMDGFEVLKAVRNVSDNERIPVLILSAKHITKEELSFLKTNHVSQLIQKGDIDKEQLLMAVENLVNEKEY